MAVDRIVWKILLDFFVLLCGWIWESYTTIGVFTFGAACQQLTSNMTKFVIGRLRPHFYDFAVLVCAWYVGLTRVQEHYHHWSDVAVGYLIGAVYGVLVFVYVLKPKKYGVPSVRRSWAEREAAPQSALPRPVLAR
ncbi:Wunen [Operophtera brumata]|uniref:Wunen n=1 Tax=Operophtera brumata TaxID=104452 RepID=A0A0L7L1Y3_OPEBR|nr:Wunen [Operophtera brumata]